MAVNLSPIWGAGAQLLDNSGNVLSGGKIYTYAAGTTTPAATYTSSNGLTANSNPIILNSAGRVPYEIWLTDGISYKFVLKDSNDVLIATYDNLTGINSNFVNFTNQQEIQTATAGQTVFTLATMSYSPGTNSLTVFVDGVNQYGPGAQYAYVETSSTVVTFVSGLHDSASVKFTTSQLNSGSGVDAAQVSYVPPFTGSVATNVEVKLSETISVKDFGAVGDGTTDDTAAIETALAALSSGGALYFPAGEYVVKRGNGSLLSDNIVSDNVTIYGDGAASKITSFNAAGTIPNNTGNEFYNVFQGTGLSGITVKQLSFSGYCTPLSLYECSNVTVDNIYDNGLLVNVDGYLRDKTIYLYKCSQASITNSYFDNFCFAVYLSGTSAADGTTDVSIANNHFTQSVAAGSFTAPFPVGVYAYYFGSVSVIGNTFTDIYSSVDSGSTGTGMGYGVYEGDGDGKQLIINGNTFQYNGKSLKNAAGVYVNECVNATIEANTIRVENSGTFHAGFLLDAKKNDRTRTVSNNSIFVQLNVSYPIWLVGSVAGSTNNARFIIDGNNIKGGLVGIRGDVSTAWSIQISNNNVYLSHGNSIQIGGASGYPCLSPMIFNNNIQQGIASGIALTYTTNAVISNNVILDGNLGNTASDAGAAIYMSSYAFGSYISGNTIGNTPYGTNPATQGSFTYGVANASNASDRIYKDILVNNSFLSIASGSQYHRFFTSSPTNGVFNVNKGDFIANASISAGGASGWFCVATYQPTLTASASSASTTVTVNSTSGLAAGDVVLLTKTYNPTATYNDYTTWHVDTIASVTDGTHFVLTTGIPVGDGTYVAGTAAVKIARYKATASIAA